MTELRRQADASNWRPLIRMNVAALAVLGAYITGACSTESGPPNDKTTSAAPDFPYPPFGIRTDVAIPLEPPLLDAAQFALDMSVDNRLKNDPHDDEIDHRFRSRIAPQIDIADLPPVPDTVAGDTGGALHRAVGARRLPDGSVEVSICAYETPGLYTKFKDGKLVGPDPARPFSLQRPLVQWTDQPAADGTTPSGPRWLLLDSGLIWNEPAEAEAVCEPFKPEPFVQKMPDPTSTTATPPP